MDSSFSNHGLDESAFGDKGLSSLRTFDAFREYLENATNFLYTLPVKSFGLRFPSRCADVADLALQPKPKHATPPPPAAAGNGPSR
jgi:hypothetical protein